MISSKILNIAGADLAYNRSQQRDLGAGLGVGFGGWVLAVGAFCSQLPQRKQANRAPLGGVPQLAEAGLVAIKVLMKKFLSYFVQ